MKRKQEEIERQLLYITHQFLAELEINHALRAISLDASFSDDLGIDSLGKVELFHRIEKRFSLHLPERSLIEADSLRILVPIIKKKYVNNNLQKQEELFEPLETMKSLDIKSAGTLIDVLSVYASEVSERPHLYLRNEYGEERVVSYGELFNQATKIANGLIKLDIHPKETIAIMLPTSEDFFYAFIGVLLIGAVPVPIYPPFRLNRIEEYVNRETQILRNAEVRAIITFSEARKLSKMLRRFVPSVKAVATVKALGATGETKTRIHSFLEKQDPALIQYTSGSTGHPKGVLLSHENILANIRAIGQAIPVYPTDVIVSWLPLYHDMGLMSWLAAMYFGIPIVILSPLTFLARPEQWLWAIHCHRATLSGAPNFAYELCARKIEDEDIEGLDLSSWRFSFNGAEAVNPQTLKRFAKKFCRYGFSMQSFAPVYGLAESTVGLTFPREKRSPLIDIIQRDIFETKHRAVSPTHRGETKSFVACGIPLENHQVRIVDKKGKEVAERVTGIIQFRGPSAMQGYYNNSKATQKAYHDGWWDTGDLGYLAGQELFVTGRKKDLIIKAGRNISPEEIEDTVSQVSGVRKGCIVAFGVEDLTRGTEKLVVVAETYQNEEKKEALRAEIIERLSAVLGVSPDTILFLPPRTVPKTSSGKLRRSACKEAFIKGRLIRGRSSEKWQLIKLMALSFFKRTTHFFLYLGKIFYTVYIYIVILLTLPFLWLSVILVSRSAAEKRVKRWARLLLWLSMCPIKVESKVDLNKNEEPTIFVANHTSYLDSLLLLAILPAGIIFVVKKELMKLFVLKTVIKKLHYLTVDRLDFADSIKNKMKISKKLRKNKSIVIFPEGTFSYAAGLRRFKLGAFAVAVELQVPLCPVTLVGARSIFRDNHFLLRPGSIKIIIGERIYPQSQEWQEVVRLSTLLRSKIAKYCEEPVIDVTTTFNRPEER